MSLYKYMQYKLYIIINCYRTNHHVTICICKTIYVFINQTNIFIILFIKLYVYIYEFTTLNKYII